MDSEDVNPREFLHQESRRSTPTSRKELQSRVDPNSEESGRQVPGVIQTLSWSNCLEVQGPHHLETAHVKESANHLILLYSWYAGVI